MTLDRGWATVNLDVAEREEQLERALDRVGREHRQVRVHVHGPGRGNRSARIEAWLAGLDPAVAVLRSPCAGLGERCFNAFAAGIEALADLLVELDPERIAELCPEASHLHALRLAFPALGRVPALAGEQPEHPVERHQLRRRALVGLAELLAGLADLRPVVLWLERAETGDRDSLALLEALGAGEAAPAMLLLVDYADDDAQPGPLLAQLQAERELVEVEGAGVDPRAELDEVAIAQLFVDADIDAAASERPAPEEALAEESVDRARSAAEAARACLALEAACVHGRRALELAGDDDALRGELLIELADDLAQLGHHPEAATRCLEAADLLGELTHDAKVRELDLRAAQLFIAAGRLKEGWGVLEHLLRAFDVQVPSSAAKALLTASWRRGRFLLRRRELSKPGRRDKPSPRDQARLDLLWFTSTRLAMVSRALSDALRTQHLGEVLRFGDESARCRAFAYEAAVESHIGAPFESSAKRLLEASLVLSKHTEDPLDRAWHLAAVAANEFCNGRWRLCVEACEAADAILREHPGVSWERAMVASYQWFALAWLGELDDLRRRVREAALDAADLDEPFAMLEACAGQPTLAWLAADEADEARERSEAALLQLHFERKAGWPVQSYRRQDYCELIARTHVALYRGAPGPAWTAVLGQWRDVELAYFTTMRTVGLELRFARARTALALAEQLTREPELDTQGWTGPRLLADVRKQIEVVAKDPICFAPPMAKLLEAGVRGVEGRRDEARPLLDQAVRGFAAVDMALHRECARYALGELIGGSEGGGIQDLAQDWMAGRGVVDPRKLAASQAPGFGLAPATPATAPTS